MRLENSVALVTGAGVRVGRAIAIALGKNGMRVAVHYNSSAKPAKETLAAIRAAGGDGDLFRADLTDPATPAKLISDVVTKMGKLDVLVNSAAGMERTPLGEVTVEQWDRIMALNLRAPFFLAQAAGKAMAERGGAIVNISDLAAYETWPLYSVHGISKRGVIQMTRALARGFAPKIRVNAIAPGAVLLPEGWSDESEESIVNSTPLKRLGSPDDVANAVIYLIQADYVTGTTLIVDGGRSVRA